MKRLWYRIRPWIRGDLVADIGWSYDLRTDTYRAEPGRTYRVRRKLADMTDEEIRAALREGAEAAGITLHTTVPSLEVARKRFRVIQPATWCGICKGGPNSPMVCGACPDWRACEKANRCARASDEDYERRYSWENDGARS